MDEEAVTGWRRISGGIVETQYMRGVFRKAMYEGGAEERAFAAQYKTWSEASASWPRTSAMLRRIAEEWERHGEQADTRAELDQRRDS